MLPESVSPWFGPGVGSYRRLPWRARLRLLVKPGEVERVTPTVPGVLLIVFTLALGTAAYNTANNLLFLTLALLLSCLIVSGLLSWLNFHGLAWRLRLPSALRVGQAVPVFIDLHHHGRWAPALALSCEVQRGDAASTVQVPLTVPLLPGQTHTVEGWLTPARRGHWSVQLRHIGSSFPFGFLRKRLAGHTTLDARVWPARLEYFSPTSPLSLSRPQAHFRPRPGSGEDLRGLRPYRPGDAPREIHWKASARLQQWVVKQWAEPPLDLWDLHLPASHTHWPNEEVFERACCFAASLLEDWFHAGHLASVTWGSGPRLSLRHAGDVASALDALAILERADTAVASLSPATVIIQPLPSGVLAALLQGHVCAHT